MDLVKQILFRKASKVDFITNSDGSYTASLEFTPSIPSKETLDEIYEEIYETVGDDWDIEISKLTQGRQIKYEVTLSPFKENDTIDISGEFEPNQTDLPPLPIERQIRDIDYQYALDFE